MEKTKDDLRHRAEEKLSKLKDKSKPLSQADSLSLIHELQVHQIELEMQNEELMRARAEAEEAYGQYTDLYDFAPVGYLTLARDGTIRQVNLAGANLLGMERGKLVNRRLGVLVDMDYRPTFNAFLKNLASSHGRETSEIRFLKNETELFWARLEGTCFEGGQEARVVMTDVTTRKQAEEALRESAAKLARSQQMGKLGSWDWNVAENSLSWSDEVYRIWGVGKDFPLTFDHIAAMIHPDDRELNDRNVQEILTARNEGGFEFRIICPDGNVKYIHQSIEVTREPGGQAVRVFGIMQDITERKQAEQALRESERTLKESQALGRVGNWELDLVTQKLKWSDEVFALYERDKALGDPAIEEEARYYSHEEAARLREFARLAGETGQDFDYDFTVRLPSGRVLDLHGTMHPVKDQTGKVFKLVGVFQDITGRKQAEQVLRESEARYRTLLESTSDSVYVLDREWRHIVVNEAATRFVQMPKAKLLGNKLTDLFPGIEETVFFKTFQRVMETRESDTTVAMYAFPDGKKGWYEVRVDPTPEGILCISRDITDRKQAEEKLRESEEEYRQIVETAGEGIWMIDTEGNTTFANQKMAEMLGSSVGDMLGVSLFNFMDEEGKAITAANLERRRQGIKEQHDFKFRRKDGTDLWAILETNPILDRDGRYAGALAMITNITGRKQAENELKESRRKLQEVNNDLQQAQSIAHIGNWRWDLRDSSVEWSDEMYRIFGIDKDSHTGRLGSAISEVIHPDDLHIVLPSNAPEFAGKKPQEYRIIHPKSGEIRHIWAKAGDAILDEQGAPIHLTGIAQDITERKRTETSLRESENKYRLLVQNMQVGVVVHAPDTSILVSNPKASQLLGLTPEQMLGKTAIDPAWHFIREDKTLLPQDEYPVTLGLATDTPITGLVLGILRPDRESPIWVQCDIHQIRESDGGLLQIVVTFFDITERKKAEELIQQYTDELEQRVSERTAELVHANRAKDDFLANMSHELRTPLNGILGFAEMLLQGVHGPVSGKQTQDLEIIYSSGQHLLGLISDILDIAKIEAGNFDIHSEVVPLNSVCQSSLVFIKQLAQKKSISVEYSPADPAGIIFADPKRLKQILVNLLNNAVKFTPERGTIKLEVREDHEANRVHFSVTDTGIGIAPEDLQKLFKPFVQLDSSLSRQHEGTGLGLSLVKKLVELHSGSIEVESELGRGSCFRVSIPIGLENMPVKTLEMVARNAVGKTATPVREVKNKRILITEDNPINRMVMCDFLASKGYEIIEAENGMEALEKARLNNPAVILMDIQMPGMNGFETIKRLREIPEFSAIPIIALTALAMPGDRQSCLEAGADEYLSKPVSLKKLAELVETMLQKGAPA